ncbi:hypothetical protein, partial [Mycobacterium celatum]|uniref:hypothetical protein n=1 Tax=Mycobacterium celatum TaxID=28045 RepID=UPI001B80D0D4
PKLRRILSGHASNPPIGIGTKPGVLQQGLTTMSALLADAAARYSQTDQAGAAGIDGAGV